MVQALHNRAAKWWVGVGFTIMTFLLLGAGGQWIGLLGTWFLDSSVGGMLLSLDELLTQLC
jgi:hypothetical protein